jgi:ribosomal protein S18 acetylase RimI-like enzyme
MSPFLEALMMKQVPIAGNDEPVRVRAMTRAEVDLAVNWAAAEGWNPGRHDAASFYATDPEGFLIAEVGGEPVGCISMVLYDGTYGFLGFYIVAPEHRSKGYGATLWRAALARAGKRTVGLDGVVAQQDNYRKSGFVFAYNNIRFETTGRPAAGPRLIPLADIPLEELMSYDARHVPVPRRRFLENWVTMPESTGFAVRENGDLAGYGVLRACAHGFKIGPLFADSPGIAETLYQALSACAPGAPVYLDVPQVNPHAMALAKRHGMKEVFQTARMYLQGTPEMNLPGVFGVTSFELG